MFVEETAAYFDTTTGFAVSATVGASSFAVIFDAGYQSALGGLVESTGPVCQAQSADVATVVQGTAITINSVAYSVTGVEADGTGITTLRLRA